MSTIIKVKCTDQVLVFDNTPLIASGGLEEDFVDFSFCSKWDGLVKTAVFWRSEKEVYHIILDDNDQCPIPPEVLADEGVIYFGVFGVNGAGKQRTSEVLRYNIVKGAITTDTKPSDPTPDIYTQLLQQYAELRNSKADKVVGAIPGNFAGLDSEGNLVDSGKNEKSFLYMSVGAEEPAAGPVLWFCTSGSAPAEGQEVMLLDLTGEDESGVVSADMGGESFGVGNATVNETPTSAGVYDFTIL